MLAFIAEGGANGSGKDHRAAMPNSTKNYSENSTDKFFASEQLDKKIKQLDKEMPVKIGRGISPAI